MVDALFVDPATGTPYTELPVIDGVARTALGTDGTTPPAISGTGIRGWLRGIYERLGGTLAVGGTVAVSNLPATQPVSGTVGVSGSVEVSNDAGNPLPVNGTVAVSNFPASTEIANDVGNPVPVSGTFFQATQPVSGTVTATGPLTNTELRATAPAVRDDYQGGEVLPDQSGVGAVLTFTFSAAVHMVVAQSAGASLTARLDPFGGTPAASTGIRLDDGVPTFVPVTATVVRVYAPSGASVAVYGLRRS